MVMAYEKVSPPKMVTWHNNRGTNKKIYFSFCKSFLTTKLDKVMTYGIGP